MVWLRRSQKGRRRLTPQEWMSVQEALIVVFRPMVGWLLALWVAGGVLAGGLLIWLGFLRWLTRPR